MLGGAQLRAKETEVCRSAFVCRVCAGESRLKAQVAGRSGLADAVRAINNLATAQGKEFLDFQHWSKKTEASVAGVVQESEMIRSESS